METLRISRTSRKRPESISRIADDSLNDEEWDRFVKDHPFGWICHLSTWKHVLEKSFPHIKGYYIALFENDAVKAALPLYSVDSWLTGRRLVSIPFATLSDPLISSPSDMETMLASAIGLSRKLKSKYIEIRTCNSPKLPEISGLGVQRHYKQHSLRLDASPEILQKTFDRTCVRQRISRACKSNLKLKAGDQESDLKKFYSLYVKQRKRQNLPPQPYIFIRNLWNSFKPMGMLELHMAVHGEQVIAAVILFKFNNRVSIEFAVQDEMNFSMSPVHFLFWETIKKAYNQGFKILDFGRTSQDNKGLMDFKKRWGTEITDLPVLYYPGEVSSKAGSRESSLSYKIMKKICMKAPAFAFPHIGSFCYRHLS